MAISGLRSAADLESAVFEASSLPADRVCGMRKARTVCYLKTSLERTRPVVILSIDKQLSSRKVECRLPGRGIDVVGETG